MLLKQENMIFLTKPLILDQFGIQLLVQSFASKFQTVGGWGMVNIDNKLKFVCLQISCK